MFFSPGIWPEATILFEKPEEHLISKGSFLTTIPKLEKNWIITFDFKPSSTNIHLPNRNPFQDPKYFNPYGFGEQKIVLSLIKEHEGARKGIFTLMSFLFHEGSTKIQCYDEGRAILGWHTPIWPGASCTISTVPKISEWTTFDITNEELEAGKCTLTVFMDGKQVGKDTKQGTREITDVTLTAASNLSPQQDIMSGHIRGLNIKTTEKPTILTKKTASWPSTKISTV